MPGYRRFHPMARLLRDSQVCGTRARWARVSKAGALRLRGGMARDDSVGLGRGAVAGAATASSRCDRASAFVPELSLATRAAGPGLRARRQGDAVALHRVRRLRRAGRGFWCTSRRCSTGGGMLWVALARSCFQRLGDAGIGLCCGE